MALSAGSRAGLALLGLACLSSLCFCTARGDRHSLSYNVTITPKPRAGDSWCEIQGHVDGNVFLSYNRGGSKVQSVSPLAEVVRATNAWGTQAETLRDIGDLLKEQLPDVTPENHTARDPLTLQVTVTCQCEDSGRTSGSWQFGFNGQICLHFDAEDGHWTVVHPAGRRMKEKWENDRAVTSFFKRVSMGDCRAWLQDFLVHWQKMLKTTASPTTASAAAPSRATALKPIAWIITWILPMVLTYFIITGILSWVLYRNRPQEIRPTNSQSAVPSR